MNDTYWKTVLQELIDIAVLEDFVLGLAKTSHLRVAVYDAAGELITAAPSAGSEPGEMPALLERVPLPLDLVTPVPANEPPAKVAFIDHADACTIVVPVYAETEVAGYVGIGTYHYLKRPTEDSGDDGASPVVSPSDRALVEFCGHTRPVILGRWVSRQLSDWYLREARLEAAVEETALLGDIGEMLSGELDLRTLLDRIVAEIARVMNLKFCSLRLYNARTESLTIMAGYNLPASYAADRTILRRDNPIDDEALNGKIVYITDAPNDPRVQFAEEAKRWGIVSGLVAGMVYRGEPVGVIRVYADYRQRFRQRHRKLLRAIASQAAIAIGNARLLEARLRSAGVERQLALARQVQDRMVLTPPPNHPQIESARVFEPSWHVGGDFCDIFELADGRFAAVVGDVVGHGVPAAVLMASARAALRSTLHCVRDLGEAFSRLNDHIYRETTTAEFVTMLLVAVDTKTRTLSYVSAGHEPLLLLRDGAAQEIQDDAGLVLGIDQDQHYPECRHDIRDHDLFLLYTDGVVEAMDFEQRMFGRERLHHAVRLYGDERPAPALRNIHWDVRRFVGLAEQSDDLTMVGFRFHEGGLK